jgi:hypothetical protein
LKIAIVHYWFVNLRGGEKVIEEFCLLFPSADVFTIVLDRASLTPNLALKNIKTSFINDFPFSRVGTNIICTHAFSFGAI